MTFVAVFAVLAFLLFAMGLGLCRAAAAGDGLLDVSRDASGRSPQRPAHAEPRPDLLDRVDAERAVVVELFRPTDTGGKAT